MISQHPFGLRGQAPAQRLRLEHAHRCAPAQQPLDDLALVAHPERHQQPIRPPLLADDVERTRLPHPIGDLGIEERADDDPPLIAVFALLKLEVRRAYEGPAQHAELVHRPRHV